MPEPYEGRHRAESITDDLTVDNVARYRAYSNNIMRTRYTGHLGVPGRHEGVPPHTTYVDGREHTSYYLPSSGVIVTITAPQQERVVTVEKLAEQFGIDLDTFITEPLIEEP